MLRNQTADFLGDPATWRDARITLDDVHGLWGGRRIAVHGTGPSVIELVQPDGRSRRCELSLSPSDVRQLLMVFIENDFLTVAIPCEAMIVPDSVRTEITLTNATGAQHSVGCWSCTAPEARFERLIHALLQIEARMRAVAS